MGTDRPGPLGFEPSRLARRRARGWGRTKGEILGEEDGGDVAS
jgi:hypothetical protein